MDLSQLKSVGEIAGIGGIALGVVVLLVRPLIGTISGLPKIRQRIEGRQVGSLGTSVWTKPVTLTFRLLQHDTFLELHLRSATFVR